jgi:cephalosporin hydroxylase
MKKFLKKKYLKLQSILSSGELNQYGKIYQTDKINENHSFSGKNYLDVYSRYLSPLKESKITLLEIGIRGGASLRTFRDYFKNGQIIGLDINPETAFKEPRITTYIGSQSSPEIIERIFKENPEINVVLDDGSHVNELTIASFNLIFNRLQKGGYYIIEDLACSYLEDQLVGDIKRGGWPGMHLNDPSIEMVNKRSDMNDFFLKLIKDIDYSRGEVEYIHFWSQICVIKKID